MKDLEKKERSGEVSANFGEKELVSEVESYLGREPTVAKVSGGYVVEYFNFNGAPPPVGRDPEEALRKFKEWYRSNRPDGEEDGNND